jgi:acyl-CoA thioesterase-1
MMPWGKKLATALLGLLLAMPARAEGPACGAPTDALEAAALKGTQIALDRGTLRVMVVGSASTQTGGTSGVNATWPHRFHRLMAARLPEVRVDLRNEGARGMTAAEHARVLADLGPDFRPHLVIWQLGTVEAARGLSADEMADTVKVTAGHIRASRGQRTDVVLMDPQFSRFLRANADVELYRDRLKMAGAASGAQLFSRWTIMKYWSETERLDLERAPRGMRVTVADELHDCLARALVEFVLDGVRAAR